MKRFSLLIAILAALSFVFIGCSSTAGGSAGDSPGITAPDMGKASDLPSSGGTNPVDTGAAIALFTGACNALNAEMVTLGSSQNPSIRAARTARTTTPLDQTININFTQEGGGTVAYTGSIAGSVTSPEATWVPDPDTTYNDFAAISMNVTVNGTLTNFVVSDASHSYTINGLVKNRMMLAASIDMRTGSDRNPINATLDFSLGIGTGTAVSISRSDGVGAKFLITYGANYTRNGINVLSNEETAVPEELTSYLASQPATLKVYDDDNNMIFEKTLTAGDAYAASILSYVGE